MSLLKQLLCLSYNRGQALSSRESCMTMSDQKDLSHSSSDVEFLQAEMIVVEKVVLSWCTNSSAEKFPTANANCQHWNPMEHE